jgi:hypothetical protein
MAVEQTIVLERYGDADTHHEGGLGFMWWFILGLNIFSDIAVLLAVLIELALAATVVALPVVLLVWAFKAMIDLGLSGINCVYYWSTGQRGARIIASQGIAWTIKRVPILELFPMYTAMFVAVAIIGKTSGSGLLGRVIGANPVAGAILRRV